MRHRAIVLLLVVTALAGCGGAAHGPGTHSRSAAAAAIPSYAGDPRLGPEEVARAYLAALDRRDGRRLCGLLAPYVAGRYDVVAREPDSLFRRFDCPRMLSALIGYAEDCCPPKFLHARVRELGEARRTGGGLLRVDATVAMTFDDQGHVSTTPVHDVIWLARLAGAWRVAKLSQVAAKASLGPFWDRREGQEDDPLARPDVAAELRAYAAARAKLEHDLRMREAQYARAGDASGCDGGTRIGDAAGDPAWYPLDRSGGAIPRIGRVDIRSVTVAGRSRGICAVFETAGPVTGPLAAELVVHQPPPAVYGKPSFLQEFDVELRADGTARVASGRDGEDRSLAVPARVGVSGDRLSVELDARSFTSGRAANGSPRTPPFGHFGIGASLTVPAAGSHALHDDLGRGSTSEVFEVPGGASFSPS
jgi:hypothetical protein